MTAESQHTASPDLIESVARAICIAGQTDPNQLWNVQNPEPQWKLFIDEARAVIALLCPPHPGLWFHEPDGTIRAPTTKDV